MKSILTIALIFIVSISAQAQTKKHKSDSLKTKQAITKTDTTKKAKAYTLFITVDSTSYIQVIGSIGKISQQLEQSIAPHNEVQASQSFLKQLYEVFTNEKKQEDKPLIAPTKATIK